METTIIVCAISILGLYFAAKYVQKDNQLPSNKYGGSSGAFTEVPKEVIE